MPDLTASSPWLSFGLEGWVSMQARAKFISHKKTRRDDVSSCEVTFALARSHVCLARQTQNITVNMTDRCLAAWNWPFRVPFPPQPFPWVIFLTEPVSPLLPEKNFFDRLKLTSFNCSLLQILARSCAEQSHFRNSAFVKFTSENAADL